MGEKQTGRGYEQQESAAAPDFINSKDGAELGLGEAKEKPKDRDVVLAQVEMEKRLALVKAWEDNEKTKADNKAHKMLSAIDAWENTKRASLEANLKQIENFFEKKNREYAEKMKNKVGEVDKAGEVKRATIEADRRKDFVMAEEAAAKFGATGNLPSKLFTCFNCEYI